MIQADAAAINNYKMQNCFIKHIEIACIFLFIVVFKSNNNENNFSFFNRGNHY